MKKLLSLILSVTLIMTILTSCSAVDKALASSYLNLGEKYLTDLDYEQALVYFNKLIEVETKNTQAYLGAAEAYLGMGDIDSAIDILEQGIATVDDSTELEAKLAEILGEDEEEKTTVSESIVDEETMPEETTEDEESEEEVEPVFVTIEEVSYYSSGGIQSQTECDLHGNVLHYILYSQQNEVVHDLSYEYEYEHDFSGNMVECIVYNSDGSLNSLRKYEYDENNNCTKYTVYNVSGSIREWKEYEYNSDGLMIKNTSYKADGSVSSWRELEYNLDGNITKEIVYSPDGSISSWCEHEYDSGGNEVKWTYCNSDGSINETCECVYDLSGNLTEEIYYFNYSNGDTDIKSYEYEYDYDSDGRIIGRKYAVYDSDGTLESTVYQTRIN